MDVYLPIANLSVNALFIVALGGAVGLLSGMFGIGGGFLTTPILIVYGIPPTVAAASSASQVTGASISGVFAHVRRGGIDVKMGGVMVAGGMLGVDRSARGCSGCCRRWGRSIPSSRSSMCCCWGSSVR